MKAIISIILSSFVMCVLLQPSTAEAYKVTDTSVTKLTDTTYLYTLTYEFGFLNADAWLPIATLNTTNGTSNTNSAVEYELSGNTTVAAVVFSDAEYQSQPDAHPRVTLEESPLGAALEQPAYYIPRGTRESFTLTALVQTDAAAPTLNVTKLPFILLREDELSLRYVGEPELEPYYITPAGY